MKKFINYVAIVATAALIPFTASALEPISDTNLKDLTGQAGVSIALDDVRVESWTGETTYTDTDGTNGTAGSVVISDKHVYTTYNAILADDSSYTTGAFDEARALSIDVGNCSILEEGINNNLAPVAAAYDGADLANAGVSGDVTEEQLAAALGGGTATPTTTAQAAAYYDYIVAGDGTNPASVDSKFVGVTIGLPSISIAKTGDSYTVGLAQDGAMNNGANFIEITKSNSVTNIYGGTLEIAAH